MRGDSGVRDPVTALITRCRGLLLQLIPEEQGLFFIEGLKVFLSYLHAQSRFNQKGGDLGCSQFSRGQSPNSSYVNQGTGTERWGTTSPLHPIPGQQEPRAMVTRHLVHSKAWRRLCARELLITAWITAWYAAWNTTRSPPGSPPSAIRTRRSPSNVRRRQDLWKCDRELWEQNFNSGFDTTYACLKAALHDVTIKKQTSKHDVTCKCTAMGRSSQRLLPVKCRCQMLTEVTTIGGCFGLYIMSQFT